MEANTNNRYITIWFALIVIGVFITQILITNFTSFFSLNQSSLFEPYRFVSAIFLHGSLLHLLFNLFALLFFGLIAENLIGSKKFFWFFIISGVFANVVSFSFYPSSLGASGAIMGLIGLVAVLKPMMAVWAFGLILPMFAVAIIWIGASIFGIFGMGESNIGYLAHLSGIFLGILYGFLLRINNKDKNGKLVVFKNSKKIQIPEEHMQAWENFYLKK